MKVKLTKVIKWRGLVRLGQPEDGYEVPDDDATKLAMRNGWVVEVAPAPDEPKGRKGAES